MTDLLLLGLAVLASWLLSGSLGPAVLAGGALALFRVFKALGLAASGVMAVSFVVLQMVLGVACERTGWFPVLYEPLGFLWHLAMAIFTWNVLVRDRDEGAHFVAALCGSVLLFWLVSSAEIFRFDPWLVRGAGCVPLAITLIRGWQPSGLGSRSGQVACLALVLLLGFASVQSNLLSRKLAHWFNPNQVFDYELAGDEALGQRPAEAEGSSGEVRLPRQANISSDDRVRFFLKLHSAEDFFALTHRPIYLRSSAVSYFSSDDTILPERVEKWLLDGDDGAADDYTALPERKAKRALSYTVVLPRSEAAQIPLLEGTSALQAREVYQLSESRYQLDRASDSPWIRYLAAGAKDILRYPAPGGFIPASQEGASRYLQLPPTALAERICGLAESVTYRQTSPETAIAQYLRRFQYSLKYKNPGNFSPVENFLFGEKKGHCELFAASAVLLLRAAGIPSRMAYGYTGGTSNRDELAIAFRSSDIHAWAEILDDQGRWQIFETTPPDQSASRLASPNGRKSINWALANYHPEGMLPAEAPARRQTALGNALAWVRSNWILLSTGSVLCAVCVFRVRRKVFPQRCLEGSFIRPESIASSRPAYVQALLELGKTRGVERGAAQTLREYLAALEERGLDGHALGEMVDYYYRTRYGCHPADPREEKRFLRILRRQENYPSLSQ